MIRDLPIAYDERLTTRAEPSRGLRALVPMAVREIVRAADPVQVILFGSVARGEEGPDSDLDFLVVLEDIQPGLQRRQRIREIRRSITVDAPIDVFVTDLAECSRRKDVPGSIPYWPMREGEVVYERAA